MSGRIKWTAGKTEQLAKLARLGLTTKAIARALDTTPSSINMRMRALGMSLRFYRRLQAQGVQK